MSEDLTHPCPLCKLAGPSFHAKDKFRDYYLCSRCQLMFVPPEFFPSAKEEKAEYDLHENNPNDERYRKFLGQLFQPMQQHLTKPSTGLDFGSGPGPTLSLMFEEVGHKVEIFDPFYAPNEAVFTRKYDFISASEVVEHLHSPQIELDRCWSCLNDGGILGIMTQLWSEQASFQQWRYKDDQTHVCFFSTKTFAWLEKRWKAKLYRINRNVHLFKKLPAS